MRRKADRDGERATEAHTLADDLLADIGHPSSHR